MIQTQLQTEHLASRSSARLTKLEPKTVVALSPILVPMRIREGDQTLTWFSTLAVFGAAGDVTLEELVVESFFPGDDLTRTFVEKLTMAR